MKVGYWAIFKICKGGGGQEKTCSHILDNNEMTIVYSPKIPLEVYKRYSVHLNGIENIR